MMYSYVNEPIMHSSYSDKRIDMNCSTSVCVLNNIHCTIGVLLKDNNKVGCLIALVARNLDTG